MRTAEFLWRFFDFGRDARVVLPVIFGRMVLVIMPKFNMADKRGRLHGKGRGEKA